jgi:predicted DCC family thiol-disulfide oxidoreductase YuxK
MPNGWTGAQYSCLRVAFGLYLLATLTTAFVLGHRHVLVVLALAGSLFFTIGLKDRWAAVLVALGMGPMQPPVGVLLLAHALVVPAAPYGSFDGRGRLDPGGGWRLPWAAQMCFRVVAAGAWLWALTIVRRGALTPIALVAVATVVLIASVFAFDPGWIRGRKADSAPSLVLYDGQCGFCHGWIRLLLAEDADGRRFRFAPLQSERAQQALTKEQRRAVGDTVVVITPEGEVLSRSDAAIHIGDRLGGGWRLVTTVLRVVPRAVRDAVYDAVARVRHRLASAPKEACPILSKPLRERFEV